MAQHHAQHQSGTGSEGTQDPRDHPWGIGAYICGLAHMRKMERMILERSWQELVHNMQIRGHDNSYLWIMAGRRVVELYNAGTNDEDGHICFVILVTADVLHTD